MYIIIITIIKKTNKQIKKIMKLEKKTMQKDIEKKA